MIKLKIISDKNVADVKAFKGEKILDVFRREDIKISVPCGGKGRCGKCRIKIEEGNVEISEADKKFFSEFELKEGYRLACNSYINENLTVKIEDNKSFNILNEYKNFEGFKSNLSYDDSLNFGYGIAVDIGTTTICFELVSLKDNKIVDKLSMLNSQAKYGADVISRISSANEGEAEELCRLARNDLLDGIKRISSKFDASLINKIVVSGNTAMLYLFLNLNCKPIGEYPFKINTKKFQKFNFEDIFDDTEFTCSVIVLPCISAFVGADVVSGALMCDIVNKNNTMLIDIGTNGEIFLNAKGKFFCASAAAGPAFEGGNISKGIGSIDGAINKVSYLDEKFIYETINNSTSIGICGSGAIDILAVFIDKGFIDETGLLKKEYFENGVEIAENINFTQNDIRQMQLAKSAIRASIECLLENSGINLNDLNKIYIAGGFGFFINLENAVKIGLFPKEFKGKMEIIGNSSLGGIARFLKSDNDIINSAEYIVNNTNEVVLNNYEHFNDLFIKYINF